MVGAEIGLVRLRERGDLETATSVGLPDAYLECYRRVPAVVASTGRPVADHGHVIVPDEDDDETSEPSREPARLGGFRGLLGLIATYFREPHRPSERQVRLVELYARQAAGVIEAARLHRELQDADRRKDEFLAMLAHELRNPLAATAGAACVASATEDREEMGWALDVIGRQSGHLARLVDDLLDASRVAQGKIELRPERIDAAAVLRQAAEAARGLVAAREHRLDAELGREALCVDADPTRLEQMAVNLLTNAARDTPTGGHIQLAAGRRGDRILFRVADNGVGIRLEEMPRLFELFVHGDVSPRLSPVRRGGKSASDRGNAGRATPRPAPPPPRRPAGSPPRRTAR